MRTTLKTWLLGLVAAIATVGALTSCSDDEAADPIQYSLTGTWVSTAEFQDLIEADDPTARLFMTFSEDGTFTRNIYSQTGNPDENYASILFDGTYSYANGRLDYTESVFGAELESFSGVSVKWYSPDKVAFRWGSGDEFVMERTSETPSPKFPSMEGTWVAAGDYQNTLVMFHADMTYRTFMTLEDGEYIIQNFSKADGDEDASTGIYTVDEYTFNMAKNEDDDYTKFNVTWVDANTIELTTGNNYYFLFKRTDETPGPGTEPDDDRANLLGNWKATGEYSDYIRESNGGDRAARAYVSFYLDGTYLRQTFTGKFESIKENGTYTTKDDKFTYQPDKGEGKTDVEIEYVNSMHIRIHWEDGRWYEYERSYETPSYGLPMASEEMRQFLAGTWRYGDETMELLVELTGDPNATRVKTFNLDGTVVTYSYFKGFRANVRTAYYGISEDQSTYTEEEYDEDDDDDMTSEFDFKIISDNEIAFYDEDSNMWLYYERSDDPSFVSLGELTREAEQKLAHTWYTDAETSKQLAEEFDAPDAYGRLTFSKSGTVNYNIYANSKAIQRRVGIYNMKDGKLELLFYNDYEVESLNYDVDHKFVTDHQLNISLNGKWYTYEYEDEDDDWL